jgi:hypothetical protein
MTALPRRRRRCPAGAPIRREGGAGRHRGRRRRPLALSRPVGGESPAIIHVDPTEVDSMAIYRGAGRHRRVVAADAAALSVWAPAGPRAAIADCKCSRPSGRLRTRLSPRRRAAGPGKQDLGPNLHRHGVPAYHA